MDLEWRGNTLKTGPGAKNGHESGVLYTTLEHFYMFEITPKFKNYIRRTPFPEICQNKTLGRMLS